MLTNRRSWVSLLFGGSALAQVPQSSELALDGESASLAWQSYRPKNRQCPVCGTMAEPWRPSRIFCAEVQGAPEPGCEPLETVTRCEHCNNAFWVRAEA